MMLYYVTRILQSFNLPLYLALFICDISSSRSRYD
jgi:hypothetical protein